MDIISSTAVKQRTVMHLFTAIVFMLLGKVTAFQSRGVCPTGWQIWEMSCYKSLSPLKTNWQEALESCHDLGANLLTPNSTEELDFIWSTFWASAPNGVWIGCTDEEGNKLLECNEEAQYISYSYRYVGGWDIYSYTYRYLDEKGNCPVISNEYPLWNSSNCNEEKYVMCERPVEIMTQTATCSIVATNRCQCLPDHTFKTLIVRGKLQCCLACHKDQLCRSFNLRGNQCELISSTDDEDLLSAALSCNHYSLK